MRLCLVLCVVPLLAITAFGQAVVGRGYGPAYYGYGPYVPLVTTPMVSLQTVSPNPVGASNATTGLVAGATNSTLAQPDEGTTSSNYTAAVWYQGGAPLTTSEVSIWPKPVGPEIHALRPPMPEEAGLHERGPRKESKEWLYFTGPEHTRSVADASTGKGSVKHAYTNDDVTRQNDNNGVVKYDGKTEKIQ